MAGTFYVNNFMIKHSIKVSTETRVRNHCRPVLEATERGVWLSYTLFIIHSVVLDKSAGKKMYLQFKSSMVGFKVKLSCPSI